MTGYLNTCIYRKRVYLLWNLWSIYLCVCIQLHLRALIKTQLQELLFIFQLFPFIFCRPRNIWSTDCDRHYTDECKSVVVHRQHAAHRPHPGVSERDGFINSSSRTMVDTKEHVTHLFTHRDGPDTRHHIQVLCERSELRKDGQDKYYYSHNRCDNSSWVIVLEASRDL